MLVAIFGGRDEIGPGRRNPFQFSIRGLCVVTLVVAVLCGITRALAELLDESTTIMLGSLFDDIPTAICWLVGGWLAWTRRILHPEVSRRVLIAIGLQLGIFIVSIAVIVWMLNFAAAVGPSLILFLLWLVVGPVSWVLLLAAAFGWRTTSRDAPGRQFRELPA
jgi:hypothetical protein